MSAFMEILMAFFSPMNGASLALIEVDDLFRNFYSVKLFSIEGKKMPTEFFSCKNNCKKINFNNVPSN